MKSKMIIIFFFLILFVTIGVDTASSQNSPVPDVTVNSSNGPITIGTNDSLSVTINLDAAGGSDNADWWVAVYTPFDWFYLDAYAGSWLPGVSFTYQGPLFNLTPVEVLNILGLPAGTYTFYFAVDMNMNGQLDFDNLHYDAVVVNVIEEATSSLVGTWVATNLDSFVSLTLTEPDILSDTNYTWVNECAEAGSYTVSGSTITFDMFYTDCDKEHSLVGGVSNLSSQKQPKQQTKSYEYSVSGDSLIIKGIKYLGSTDLLLNLIMPKHVEIIIGEGTVRVDRYKEWSGCGYIYEHIYGDIPFKISYFEDEKGQHYYVKGEGDLEYSGEHRLADCVSLADICDIDWTAKGKAYASGFFSNSGCKLGILIDDNYYWDKCSIFSLREHEKDGCGGLYVGWTNDDPCVTPKPALVYFPLTVGATEKRGHPDEHETYKIMDLHVDEDFTISTGCHVQ